MKIARLVLLQNVVEGGYRELPAHSLDLFEDLDDHLADLRSVDYCVGMQQMLTPVVLEYAPEPLDGVELGLGGRQEEQDYAVLFSEILDAVVVMRSVVVEHDYPLPIGHGKLVHQFEERDSIVSAGLFA